MCQLSRMCAASVGGVGGRGGQMQNFSYWTSMQNCDAATCVRWPGICISSGVTDHVLRCRMRDGDDVSGVQQPWNVIAPNLQFYISCGSGMMTCPLKCGCIVIGLHETCASCCACVQRQLVMWVAVVVKIRMLAIRPQCKTATQRRVRGGPACASIQASRIMFYGVVCAPAAMSLGCNSLGM